MVGIFSVASVASIEMRRQDPEFISCNSVTSLSSIPSISVGNCTVLKGPLHAIYSLASLFRQKMI